GPCANRRACWPSQKFRMVALLQFDISKCKIYRNAVWSRDFGKRKRPGVCPAALIAAMAGVLPAGQDALHELLHRRDEAVRVERVARKTVAVMAAEHQVAFQGNGVVALMGDVLQRLLDAEAARIGLLAGAVV